jgi:2'-5' RNA ligase
LTKARLGRPRLRLFVGLELPAQFKRQLVEWRQRTFASEPGFRLLGPENLHITLVFLGYQYERDLDLLKEALRPPPGAAFQLRVAQLVGIGGGRNRGRAFALQMHEDEQLGGWQAALVDRMAQTGLHDPEKRPFWPHVTVVRTKAKTKLHAPSGAGELPDQLLAPFEADRVTMFKSVLHPSGARYEPLESLVAK